MANNLAGKEDTKQRITQYGIQFPNGDFAFTTQYEPRSSLLAFLSLNVDLSTSEGRGKARDEYERQFNYLGVANADVPQIKFVKRVRYVSYSAPEMI